MTRRRSVAAVLAAFISIVVVVGCSSGSSGGSSADSAKTSHLSKILDSNKIRIAVSQDNPPWSVMNTSSQYEGFDIDLATALAKSLKADIEWVVATDETRIPILQADKADVVIATFTETAERAQSVDFSIPYAATGVLIAVAKDSGIKAYDDLAGKTVAASRGSTGAIRLKSSFPDATLKEFNNTADAFQAVKSGQVDGVIDDMVLVPEFAKKNDGFEVLQGSLLSPAVLGMGVQQSDQQWLNYVNSFIRSYVFAGGIETAYQKWLGTGMPDYLR